jgi:hypothetical protein
MLTLRRAEPHPRDVVYCCDFVEPLAWSCLSLSCTQLVRLSVSPFNMLVLVCSSKTDRPKFSGL